MGPSLRHLIVTLVLLFASAGLAGGAPRDSSPATEALSDRLRKAETLRTRAREYQDAAMTE